MSYKAEPTIFKGEVTKLIEQYKRNAEAMRSKRITPHVPAIWETVVKDLEQLPKR